VFRCSNGNGREKLEHIEYGLPIPIILEAYPSFSCFRSMSSLCRHYVVTRRFEFLFYEDLGIEENSNSHKHPQSVRLDIPF
jgi:hypothetical protein